MPGRKIRRYVLLGTGLTIACFMAFHAGAQGVTTGQPVIPKSLSSHTCNKGTFKIALDIGHDKIRPGATSARGVTEFNYNLALGGMVLRALRANGFSAAFLIGESGEPMPLARRPQIARQEGAALFMSLHHDSVQKQYLSQWSFEGRTHPYSDRFHGYSIFISTSSPWARNSLSLATSLGRALKMRGFTPSMHHAEAIAGENRMLLDPDLGIYRFDELVVLHEATMPALLLESAVIVNRAEEQTIRFGTYHPGVASAIVDAITQYCSARID